MSESTEIERVVARIVGLRLSVIRRGGAMRIFHFGAISVVSGKMVGEFALHIQCPWRLEDPSGMIAGALDINRRLDGRIPLPEEDWDYEKNGTCWIIFWLHGLARDQNWVL